MSYVGEKYWKAKKKTITITCPDCKNEIRILCDVEDLLNSVDCPDHHNSGIVERIDVIRASMTGEEFKGFLKGNLEKYVMRYELNDEFEELEKARYYMDMLIEEERYK